jgi:hypothetical protein
VDVIKGEVEMRFYERLGSAQILITCVISVLSFTMMGEKERRFLR